MRLITSLLLFLGIGSGSHLFAGTTDPGTPDSKYVEFGREFPNVLRIRNKIDCTNPECSTKEHTQFGSSVVIAPHWVLTAAHVVHGSRDVVVLKDDGTEYPMPYVVVHKDFEDGSIGFYDIALCYSPKSFDLKFYTPLYRKTDEVGKAITIAGYGIHGTFSVGGKNSDGKKRGGHNVIDNTERGVLVCKPTSGRGRMPLEFGITPGDSGGGMFIGNELAGINSFIMAIDKVPDGTYGDESAFTRVSLYADWVDQQIEKHTLALQGRATTAGDVRIVDLEVQP